MAYLSSVHILFALHLAVFVLGPPSTNTLCIYHPSKPHCAQVVWGQRELTALSAQTEVEPIRSMEEILAEVPRAATLHGEL